MCRGLEEPHGWVEERVYEPHGWIEERSYEPHGWVEERRAGHAWAGSGRGSAGASGGGSRGGSGGGSGASGRDAVEEEGYEEVGRVQGQKVRVHGEKYEGEPPRGRRAPLKSTGNLIKSTDNLPAKSTGNLPTRVSGIAGSEVVESRGAGGKAWGGTRVRGEWDMYSD